MFCKFHIVFVCYALCCALSVLCSATSLHQTKSSYEFPSMAKRRREAMAKVKFESSNALIDDDIYSINGTFHAPFIDPKRYPICTDTIWVAGNPDIFSTLFNCTANIANQLNPPSYLNYSNPVIVGMDLYVISLIELNEMDNSVSLQLYWDLYWFDQRYNMPQFWADQWESNKNVVFNGIELSMLIADQDTPLNVWLPDLFFELTREQLVVTSSITLHPDGGIYWGRDMIVKIGQPHLAYAQYPMDTQDLQLTVYSMGFVNKFLQIRGLTETLYMQADLGSIWDYVDSSVSFSETEDEDFSTCLVSIRVSRQSAGVVYRLAFPIMLMLLLVGLTFWGEHSSRVDTTITILLSVSALYIVVFSSVPMIGTLTEFDKYIIVMFLMVSMVIFLHQFTTRLILKADHLPMRMVYARLLECFGKVFVIPVVFFFFAYKFPPFLSYHFRVVLAILVLCFAIMVAMREYTGLRRTLKDALVFIRNKIEKPAGHELSTIEVATFNYFTFGVCSRSAAHYHRWKKEHDRTFSIDEPVATEAPGSHTANKMRRGSSSVDDFSEDGIVMYDIADYYKKEDIALKNVGASSSSGITGENEVVSAMHEL